MDKGAVFHKRYLFAHQAYCSERWPWRPDEWKSYLERGVSGWPVFSFAFSRTCLNRSVIWLDWQKSQCPYATELNPFTCPLALKQVLQHIPETEVCFWSSSEEMQETATPLWPHPWFTSGWGLHCSPAASEDINGPPVSLPLNTPKLLLKVKGNICRPLENFAHPRNNM